MIVYCYNRGITNSLSKSLYCLAYNSKVIDREGVLKRFIFSDNGTVIATSSLGLGVNAPNINAILYIKALRLFKNYAQKNKKAGCDKRVSQTIIFLNDKINTFINRNKAHRAALSKYI